MSGLSLLAQATGEPGDVDSHFIDDFVDTVTNLDAADGLADWVTSGVEWAVAIALFAVPALLIFGGIREPSLRAWCWRTARIDRGVVVPQPT